MQSPLSTGSPTAGCLVRWFFRQHSIEPGLREPELSTLTGEFDPPHVHRMSQAKGKIRWSGITAIEEYSIHCPEHQDLICFSSARLEHCQNAASRFLRSWNCSHVDPHPGWRTRDAQHNSLSSK